METKKNAIEKHGFDPHSVFVETLAGRLSSDFVYKDELVSAFMDVQPITEGHVLVVPNQKAASLSELPPETGERIFRVGQSIAAAIRTSDLKCEGINLFLADGKAAGQTVFHVHLHIFPRYKSDGFRWLLPEQYHTPPTRECLRASCEEIKKRLL